MTAADMISDTIQTFDMTQIPLGRVSEPREIADVVAWLCSDESSYVASANVRVAGGRPPGTTIGSAAYEPPHPCEVKRREMRFVR